MAIDLAVRFASPKLPTLAAWEQAAADLGFRLRVHPANLLTQTGVLPVAFNADEHNSGFEFQIRADWERSPRTLAVLGDRDVVAWFKCFSGEWTETVWSAVAFAKACDGLFSDEFGGAKATLEEAVAFAREHAPIAEPGAAPDSGRT
jgi:hypothetical protein